MKKAVVLFLFSIILLTLCGCDYTHYDSDSISLLYDSEWIVGSTREEIERKYGDFDREYASDSVGNVGAYYVNYENSGIDPSYIHDTYFVLFNDDDIAVDAYFRETSIGG